MRTLRDNDSEVEFLAISAVDTGSEIVRTGRDCERIALRRSSTFEKDGLALTLVGKNNEILGEINPARALKVEYLCL